MTLGLAYTLISAFAIGAVGVTVFLHNSKSATNRLFALMAISSVFWSFANYYSTIFPDNITTVRLVLFFAVPHILLFLLFTLTFPQEHTPLTLWQLVLGTLFGTALMAYTQGSYVFSHMTWDGTTYTPVPGALMPVFGITVLGSLFAALIVMAHTYARAPQEQKNQWIVMFAGTLVSYASLIFTNFVLVVFFKNTNFIVFGPLFMLPTFIGMTIAILRHKLFDARVAGAELLTFAIVFISLANVLTSQTLSELIRSSIFLGLFTAAGAFLIRAVINEVKQREQITNLAQELEAANERLKQLDMQKSEFLSIATHQLRGPLAAIRGHLSLLLDGSYGAISEEAKKVIAKVFTSGTLMTETVNDFLNVSRIEQGSMQYEYTDFNVAEMVKDIVEELQPAASDHTLTLTLEGGVPNAMVHADYGKIRHIFFNLIDNAIKYTPQGWVKAVVHTQPKVVRVEISDSGIGIAPDKIDTLFQKFVRMREATGINISGTGLGLYVAKQMVEAHNGKIWAQSEGLGKGTTFVVELPLSAHESKPPETKQS